MKTRDQSVAWNSLKLQENKPENSLEMSCECPKETNIPFPGSILHSIDLRGKIVNYIRESGHTITAPTRLRSPPNKRRNKHLYSRHHRDYGHTTKECFHLK